MDTFREKQKKRGRDYSPKPRDKYGCSCCRGIRDLRTHKLYSRRLARKAFKVETQKLIREEENGY